MFYPYKGTSKNTLLSKRMPIPRSTMKPFEQNFWDYHAFAG